MDYNRNSPFTNVSKNGIIGALAGLFASIHFHKTNERPVKKAIKTGIFTGLGYLLGIVLEKLFKKRL
jgi:hypothetical protein